jgi:pyridoxamine 5'-phosphate oxidase family protein
MPDTLTPAQIDYIKSQFLGRLATVRPDDSPQNNPVGVFYNPDLGTIDIGGHHMGTTAKFRNIATNPRVAVVVDDIVSTNPFVVRCLEIRGTATALTDVEPPQPGFSREIIRIEPERVLAYGID